MTPTPCPLTGYVYDKSCPHCMLRKIKSLRSPNGKLSRQLQTQMFLMMPLDVAEEVKRMLKDAKEVE